MVSCADRSCQRVYLVKSPDASVLSTQPSVKGVEACQGRLSFIDATGAYYGKYLPDPPSTYCPPAIR